MNLLSYEQNATFCFPNLISTFSHKLCKRSFPFSAYDVKSLHHDDRVDEFSPFSFGNKHRNHTLSAPYILQFITNFLKRDVPISDISFIIMAIITDTLIQQFFYADAFYENDRREFHWILLNPL